jgi:hypothetical protein
MLWLFAKAANERAAAAGIVMSRSPSPVCAGHRVAFGATLLKARDSIGIEIVN